MNATEPFTARNIIRKIAVNHLNNRRLYDQLEKELFNGSPDKAKLQSPQGLNKLFEDINNITNEINDVLDGNSTPPITDKNDPNAFVNIIKIYTDSIRKESEITTEFCNDIIAELQEHFAGTIMLSEDNTLFLYEP